MLVKTVKKILSKDERLINDNEFNITKLYNLLEKYDSKILKELYQNEDIKNKFFKNIDGINIFKQEEFKFFLQHQKPFENGWTKLKNTIGLCDGKYLLRDTQDIVLNFPFKDCVLEGGQSTDEVIEGYFNYETTSFKEEDKAIEAELIGKKIEVEISARGKKTYSVSGFKEYNGKKRKEVFFNEILAKDEIDRLLEKKALVNWRRYTKDGSGEVKEINRDKNGAIKENLIIKGNNLLALYGLKKEFFEKIRLIYIDPPYNTGNDSFSYNDNFNHSTWLTFMKNRLEVAKELLRKDGMIFVQCDDNEQAYLKVLMDEVFGKENFINTICVKMSEPTGVKMAHVEKRLPKLKEYILLYKKENIKLNIVKIPKGEWDSEYKIYIDNLQKEEIQRLKEIMNNENRSKEEVEEADKICSKMKLSNVSKVQSKTDTLDWLYENSWRILRSCSSAKNVKELADKKRLDVLGECFVVETKQKKMYVVLKDYNPESSQPRLKLLFADDYLEVNPGDFWSDINTTGLEAEGKVQLKNGKKPEELIERIIKLATDEEDIVLDYHLGSGTTCAVAHKLNRQYIGIEQMNYIETLTLERLKNVIKGEQGGISRSVKWQGGGEFIYFELAKFNEEAKDKILDCETSEELENLFDKLYNKYYLNYNLNIKKFKELIKTSEFKELCLDDMKKMYLSMLDLNSMYINFEDMEDDKFDLSDDDIKLTKQFYGVK